MALDKNLFQNWVEGQQFTARDYVYERNLIIDYINEELITQEEVLAGLFDTRYYTETELNPAAAAGANVLDARYYTETELNAGQLNSLYYTESEINGFLTTEQNRISRLESKFDATVLAENDQLIDQALNTDSDVEFNQVTTPTAIVNGVNVGTTLANKTDIGHSHVITDITDLTDNFYTETEVDDALALKIDATEKGVANGVATLDGDGRLPVSQLPLETIVFRGTFGSVNSTTGGDLPSNGSLEKGDFYICDTDAFVSTVAGVTFDNGDKAIYTGTAWSKIDNNETVTSVNGDIGDVVLDYTDVGAAPLVHEHDWTDLTSGVPTTVAGYGITDAYTKTELDGGQLDNRYYTENELINGGAIDGRYYTEVELDAGQLDNRYYTETELDAGQLDNRYYTETELDPLAAQGSNVLDARYYTNDEIINGVLDERYYTETELDSALALKLNTSLKGAPNGLAELGADGKVPAGQLPSYVDDVLEYTNLAGFPATGETGKIYVALDTLKTYRWSGSAYVEIAANEVNSVNGYTGVVTVSDADIAVDASGFTGVLDTDATNVELALAELDAHTHAYSEITDKPSLYTQAQVDALLAEKADVANLSATITLYDNTVSELTATNLQDAVDELDALIAQNTSVIKIQRFVITNPDNGDGTFSYVFNGNPAATAPLVGGEYQFPLQESVEYIVGQNRLEIKVNNDVNYYSPDTEISEINTSTVGVTHALQTNDEVFIKVYQGLDSVALTVQDGSITTLKLSTPLQNKISSYDSHLAITDGNPHGVDKADVGLGNVTNDAQVKADPAGSIDGNVATWLGTSGDALGTGYGVQTTLSSSTGDLVRADAIQTAVDTINSAIAGKQDTLVSATNIKTLNGSSLLGSGNLELEIPAVTIDTTAPSSPNEGDLWWDSTSAVLYIYYNDGVQTQWVSVSYADVDAAINNLIANAPAALDTLNELAAALGDDPNFATTIAADIAAKADQTDLDTLETTVDGKADKNASFVTISANHTLVLTDAGKVLEATNSAAITVTVPTNATIAFPVGTQIAVLRNGAGTVTFAGASGVTVNSKDSALAIAGQYASAALLKIDTDEWQLVGSLE